MYARRVPGDAAQSYIYLLRKLADAENVFMTEYQVTSGEVVLEILGPG